MKEGWSESSDKFYVIDHEKFDKNKALLDYLSQYKEDIINKKTISDFEMLDHFVNLKDLVNIEFTDQKLYQFIQKISSKENIDSVTLPKKLEKTLRPYQVEGVSWLSFLFEHKFGACLADDMGLGKTLQLISLLVHLRSAKSQKTLIVVPATLVSVWIGEIQKFYPEIKLQNFNDIKDGDIKNNDYTIISYDLLRRNIETIEKIKFDVAIYDEAQYIKNYYSQRSVATRQVNATSKFALTGTPLENHIMEFYSIMELVNPGLLGNISKFKKAMNSDSETKILQKSKMFFLRRKKKDILTELPDKIESTYSLSMSEEQKDLHEKLVESYVQKIDLLQSQSGTNKATFFSLRCLMRLRQVCLNPRLISNEYVDHSPKVDYLADQLKMLIAENHSVLVFSQFTSFLDQIQSKLDKEDMGYFRIDGGINLKKREKLLMSFARVKSQKFS